MSISIDPKTATLEELAGFIRVCGQQAAPRERGVPEADAYIWRVHAGNLGSMLLIAQAVLDRHYPPPEEDAEDASGRQHSPSPNDSHRARNRRAKDHTPRDMGARESPGPGSNGDAGGLVPVSGEPAEPARADGHLADS